MRRLFAVLSGVVVLVVSVAVVAAATKPRVSSPVTIRVIEHATTDVVIDTGDPGDTTGDLLTWHNKIFDAANANQVGRDQGDCIRINPAAGTWECRWITWIPGGALTVEGAFYDTRDSTFAITGGKGGYRNARGTMDLKARHGGTEFAFTFHVLP